MGERRTRVAGGSCASAWGRAGWVPLAGGLVALAAPGCAVAPQGLRQDSPYWGPIRSSDVDRGRTRFDVVCAPCHVRREMDAPELTALGWSPADVRHQIREGSALMPSIPQRRLDDEDLEHLLAYLESSGVVTEMTDADVLGTPDAQ